MKMFNEVLADVQAGLRTGAILPINHRVRLIEGVDHTIKRAKNMPFPIKRTVSNLRWATYLTERGDTIYVPSKGDELARLINQGGGYDNVMTFLTVKDGLIGQSHTRSLELLLVQV